ncbi:ribonuclease H family protein [Intestinibacter sp.]|uniref:ribonuclease H family protein n=1 Tax=Intestinibacter sp. TaxID=1965304 RepID=UPI002A761747|nr:ribonuclease H family protein [Intestinibacter sp.]MDY2734614.1 ribonuclease H family protein [Intestinibacter sp.]MDY4576113.1 ribonuclease H family protein [Intestinibacter sp.]
MAKKKVYAIKEGFDFSKNQRVQNKLVDSWNECQKYIKGVKGAIYKSFEDVEEAKSFLQNGSELLRKGKDSYDENCLHIYVDGSYNSASRKFSYGVVAVYNDIVEYVHGGSGKNAKDNNIRQIAGELKAAVEGVEYALKNGHKKVVVFHDYEGICHHATGFWQRKDKSSKDYYEKMNSLMDKGIEIQFVQVKSHQEDLFNEMADTICKKELGIDNDKILEKHLSNNQILVKNQDVKEKIESLITKGYENIVVLGEDKNIPKISESILDENTDAYKQELIEKINEILENLENERLEEVLRYVRKSLS